MTTTMAARGQATTIKKTFSRTTTVSQLINVSPSEVWAVLINAGDYPRWNSTIISLEGEISPGAKIKLKSTLDPSRTFGLKVKEMLPDQKMVWGDAMGRRTYSLEQQSAGTLFTMTETIGGPIFPLFASKIPPFDDAFEQFAADLKTESERNAN